MRRLLFGLILLSCLVEAQILAPVVHSVSNKGQVGYWKLDEGTGTSATDSSGTGNTGTWTGTPSGSNGNYTAGQVGPWAGAFVSANSNKVSAGTSTSLSPAAITVMAWVFASAFPNAYNSVISRENNTGGVTKGNYTLLIKSTGKLAIYLSDVLNNTGNTIDYDGSGSHTLVVNQWYHLAFTYIANGNLVGYVNGAVDATVAGTALAINGGTAYNFLIGNYFAGGRNFSGLIDDVQVFNYAMTAAQISRYYTSTNCVACQAPWFLSGFINGTEKLYFFNGYDAVAWRATQTAVPPYYTSPTGSVRDPAATIYHGQCFAAYTIGVASQFGLATSPNCAPSGWSSVGVVSVGVPCGGCTLVAMGRIYVEGGNYCIPLTIGVTITSTVSVYWKCTTNPSSTSGWSGETLLSGLAGATDYIDAQVFCLTTCSGGSGSYALLIVNDTVLANEAIELYLCSTNCLSSGTWTQTATGNWAGWSIGGHRIEAPNVIKMSDRWRIFFLDVSGPTAYYSDCLFSAMVCWGVSPTWSAPATWNMAGLAWLNGSVIPVNWAQ